MHRRTTPIHALILATIVSGCFDDPPRSPIVGSITTTFITPTTSIDRPRDLSNTDLVLYFDTGERFPDDGTFHGDANGGFTTTPVPEGPFVLRIGDDHYEQASERVVVFHEIVVGDPDASPASVATPISLHLTDLASGWAPTDQLVATVTETGSTHPALNLELQPPPTNAATDITGGTSDVYAVDAVTGRPVLHRTFDGNTNPQGGSLVNLAVSPDGVLVMLLNQRVLSHDLYDASSPDADAHADLTARMNPNDPPFKLADGDGEGQLVVTDDTVLAVYHAAGTNAASVWAYGLRSMKPLSVNDDRQHRSVQVTFGPRSNEKDDLGVTVVASGPSVYVVGQHALAGYRLDYPTGAGWQQQAGAGDRGLGVGLLLARDLAVLVTQQGMNNPAATRLTAIRLYIYDRTPLPDKGRENGMLEQYPILREPAAGFLAGQWQLADHAFYYVTGDQKLKILRASDQAG